MKKALLLLVTALLIFNDSIIAQKTSPAEAKIIAGNINSRLKNENSPVLNSVFLSGNDTIAFIFGMAPKGFVIVSGNHSMPPVIAYSEEGNFNEGEAWNTFLPLLKKETELFHFYPDIKYTDKWNSLLNSDAPLLQQWPPEGYSPTGGWLFTNWTQNAPYNDMCPLDGGTLQRSYAGCPATAMAQILNYHREIHGTRFSNEDDYYHSYGANNQYQIDDDHVQFDFPSWDELNVYLDTLDAHFADSSNLTNDDKAALTYACGVAAKQVYSSAGSGTFGVSQAYDAYMRFGFDDAILTDSSDPDLNTHLAKNMKAGLPAHLALVDAGWSVGHNVVVDGYNTDELFHFNFGWGGSANGWYTMPPTNIPYNLTVIEGVILDINLSSIPSGIKEIGTGKFRISAVNREIIILNQNSSERNFNIFDISGRSVYKGILNSSEKIKKIKIQEIKAGLYIFRTDSGEAVKFIY